MSTTLLRMVEDTRKAIMMAAYGGDINGWVCVDVFIKKTGLKTCKQRYDFRKKHPNLVKSYGNKHIFDLPGYFALFK